MMTGQLNMLIMRSCDEHDAEYYFLKLSVALLVHFHIILKNITIVYNRSFVLKYPGQTNIIIRVRVNVTKKWRVKIFKLKM